MDQKPGEILDREVSPKTRSPGNLYRVGSPADIAGHYRNQYTSRLERWIIMSSTLLVHL